MSIIVICCLITWLPEIYRGGGTAEVRLIQYVFGSIKIKLGDFAEVGTGNSNGNEAVENGLYPFFIRSQSVKAKNNFEFDEEALIIPGEGGIGDIFHYINGQYALHQRVYRIHFKSNIIDTKYVYYYMNAFFKRFILRKAVDATVKSIRKPMIEDFVFELPPLEEQKRVVSILDKFDKLCNDLTSGIPAHINALEKQYEYFRNKLLTFEQKKLA